MHTIFIGPNRIEVPYGVYGPASGRNHKGGDVDTPPGNDPTAHSTVHGCAEYSGVIPKGSDLTWQWGYHVRIFEGQKDTVIREGTLRHTFAHCKANSLLVKRGDIVQAGRAIATMGKTGNAEFDAQGEHVHYQVDKRINGSWVPQDPTPWCGGNNTVGTWPAVGHDKEDDKMYRLYQVIFASLDKKAADKQFDELLASGMRVGYDRAGSDGRYRIGKCVQESPDPKTLRGQINENYFIG